MDTKVKPPKVDPPEPDEDQDDLDEAMPRVQITRRSLVLGLFFIVSAIAFLYFVLPQLTDLKDTGERVGEGNRWWLAAAVVFTLASFGGYVMMFQGIFVRDGSRIDWRASYQITMAGLAATRLFAAGGAGGIALTAWALRRSGMPRRKVADKTLAFLILTYAVYMAALVVCGFGLYFDLLPGPGPFAITVVPGAVRPHRHRARRSACRACRPDLQRRLEGFARRGGRLARIAQRLANAPAAFSAGMREAICHVRERDPALLGAIAYWAFNIAVLWACFHAFGDPPPLTVIVMGYFVGFLGNLLPLPGGIGGVDGGMIGAFAAFGVPLSLVVPAVLAYRIFTFWLPTIPGAIAYFQLRRTVARWREERHGRSEVAAAASA